jgi:hypothetical protein
VFEGVLQNSGIVGGSYKIQYKKIEPRHSFFGARILEYTKRDNPGFNNVKFTRARTYLRYEISFSLPVHQHFPNGVGGRMVKKLYSPDAYIYVLYEIIFTCPYMHESCGRNERHTHTHTAVT